MKILHVIPTLSSGGAERFVTDLTNELAKNDDCQISLLTLKKESEENDFYKQELSEKITYINLGTEKVVFKDLFKIYRTIKKEKPDIVHYHLAGMLNLLLLTILLYRKPVYVETIHSDIKAIVGTTKRDRWIKSVCYRSGLIKVCTITPSNGASFKKFYHRDCAAVIVNGRKPIHPSPLFETRRKEIERYKNTSNTLVFTHIGRFTKAKNHKLLITAFNTFVKRGHDAILLIIGNGYDSPTGKIYQAHACENIHFLGERHEVQDYLLNGDAFCLSSIFEGMPITLIESFACGCIPISTPVCGAVDFIENGKTGFLSKDYSKESYLEALEDFAHHHQLINKNDLTNIFHIHFAMNICAEKYHSLYSYLTDNKIMHN